MKLDIPNTAPKDAATLHRWLLEAFRRAGDAWGGCIVLRRAVGTTETAIAHGQIERPLACFWSADGVVRVGRTRADDNRCIYLRASTATIVDLLVIPGFSRELAGTIAPLDADVAELDAGVEAEPTEAATSVAQVTIRGYRHRDPGGAYAAGTTRIHWAGMHAANAGVWMDAVSTGSVQAAAGGMAYCYPESFDYDVVINRLLTRTASRSGAAGGNARLAVYANTTLASGAFAGSNYPGALLGQSGNLAYPGGAHSLLETTGLSIAVARGERVWFCWVQDAAGVAGAYGVPAYPAGGLFPFLGFIMDHVTPTSLVTENLSAGVCWRHSITYTGTESWPDPFPQSAPVVGTLTSASVPQFPAVGFGAQAA